MASEPSIQDDASVEDEPTLVDMLALSSRLAPEDETYMAHLTDLTLPELLAEPTTLQTEAHHLTSSLTTLTHTSYPAFLSLHTATTSLSTSLSVLSTSLDGLLGSSLPKLDESLVGWKDRTGVVLGDRKRARVVLDQYEKIRDLLDTPLLIDTCVRNGYFAEALSLASHTTGLASSLPGPPPPILQSIRAEVQQSVNHMLLTLLGTLHEPNRKLTVLWKAVNFIRKMEVFDNEEQIALAFLGGREGCLKSALDNCGRDVQALILGASSESGNKLGEREREDIAKYMKKYIDTWREGVSDIVTQYTTIFLERQPGGATSASATPVTPIAAASTPTSQLRTLVTTYASHALSTHLIPPLKTLLPLVPSALPSLLTQLTYCANAYARLGMDFRGILDGLFSDAVEKSVCRELKEAGTRFRSQIKKSEKKTKSRSVTSHPSAWLIVSSLASSPPTTSTPAPANVPPTVLASYPPLAELTNAILSTLNGLRLLAPVSIISELMGALDDVLTHAGKELFRCSKDFLARKDLNLDATAMAKEKGVLRATGEMYIKVLVPFIRRALKEGVYGLEDGESKSAAELDRLLVKYQEWINSLE